MQSSACAVGVVCDVPSTSATAPLMQGQNGATATKAVILAAIVDVLDAQQCQSTCAHDAWLTSHIQAAPAVTAACELNASSC